MSLTYRGISDELTGKTVKVVTGKANDAGYGYVEVECTVKLTHFYRRLKARFEPLRK